MAPHVLWVARLRCRGETHRVRFRSLPVLASQLLNEKCLHHGQRSEQRDEEQRLPCPGWSRRSAQTAGNEQLGPSQSGSPKSPAVACHWLFRP